MSSPINGEFTTDIGGVLNLTLTVSALRVNDKGAPYLILKGTAVSSKAIQYKGGTIPEGATLQGHISLTYWASATKDAPKEDVEFTVG
jgi:hypothetical protein